MDTVQEVIEYLEVEIKKAEAICDYIVAKGLEERREYFVHMFTLKGVLAAIDPRK